MTGEEYAGRLWMWFGQGDGPATLLMVLTQTPGGFAYQPLIAGSLVQANEQAEIAERAAAELGCDASLREYQLVHVHDLKIGVQS